MKLSLLEECRSCAKQALGALGAGGARNPREEMRLHSALGASTPEVPEMGAAFTKTLDIVEALGDTELSLSETLYAWRAGANRAMLIPNGRCSRAAVVCANQHVSLKSKA
jgi:hypothetical protein